MTSPVIYLRFDTLIPGINFIPPYPSLCCCFGFPCFGPALFCAFYDTLDALQPATTPLVALPLVTLLGT